jgi:hypothetical protein
MTYGTHQMQLMPAAGVARQASRIRPSAAKWSAGITIGTGVLASAKPCTHVVPTTFGDLTNHRQPEEAPL